MPRAKATKAGKATPAATPTKRTKATATAKAKPATSSGTESKLATDLLAAVNSSELSRYEIAKRAGVSAAALSYFVNGQRSLSLESAGRVADVLGLELRTIERQP